MIFLLKKIIFLLIKQSALLKITAAAVILLSSCTENVPEIKQVFWQINKYYNIENNTIHEKLSVFVHAHDEDGIDDIKTIYIINDYHELFWMLKSDEWDLKISQNENWIGSNNIIMNDFSSFPSGNYRIIIIDDAGKRDEQVFSVASGLPVPRESDFPWLTITGRKADISEKTEVIWFYDKNNIVIQEEHRENLSDSLIEIPDNAEKIRLYRLDRSNGYGLVSGPFYP